MIAIHFGLHKTGTSFLQKEVFPKLNGVTLIRFNPWATLLTEMQESSRILVSNEGVLGLFQQPNWIENQLKGIKGLGQLLPSAKMILSVRRHETLLLSLYAQYLHEGGTASLERFYDFHGDAGILSPNQLLFQPRIEAILESFNNPPFVFLYEEIRHNLSDLLRDICEYVEVSVIGIGDVNTSRRINVGVRYYQGKLLRLLNRVAQVVPLNNKYSRRLKLHPRGICQHWLGRFPRRKVELSAEQRAIVSERYDADWKWVVEFLRNSPNRSLAIQDDWIE